MVEQIVPYNESIIKENQDNLVNILYSTSKGNFSVRIISKNEKVEIKRKGISKILSLISSNSLRYISFYSHSIQRYFLVNEIEGYPLILNSNLFMEIYNKRKSKKEERKSFYSVFNEDNQICCVEPITIDFAYRKQERHLVKLIGANNQPVLITENNFLNGIKENNIFSDDSSDEINFTSFDNKIECIPKANIISGKQLCDDTDNGNTKKKKIFCINFSQIRKKKSDSKN